MGATAAVHPATLSAPALFATALSAAALFAATALPATALHPALLAATTLPTTALHPALSAATTLPAASALPAAAALHPALPAAATLHPALHPAALHSPALYPPALLATRSDRLKYLLSPAGSAPSGRACQAATPPMQLRSHQRTSLRVTLNAIPGLIDPAHGPILALQPRLAGPGDPGFAHVHAWAGSTLQRRGRPSCLRAGGSALTWPQALVKAVGESVERYSVLHWEPRVHLAQASALDAQIDMRSYDLFHSEQRAAPGFAFSSADEHARMSWVEAFSLTHGKASFVPATLAHLYHQAQTEADRFDLCPVSGYACGNTLEEALLGALCEVIERDALMIAWYQRLAVPSLDLASMASGEVRDAVQRYARSPVRLYCANLTTDIGIPAVLVMMTSQHPGWPAAAVATAADMSVERAVVKALCELSAGHWLVRGRGRRPRSMLEVQEPEDHGLFYAAPSALHHLDRFLRPRSSLRAAQLAAAPATDDVKVLLDEAVRRLAARGLETLAVELSAPEVAAQGLHVVKVIVPGLQPLDFGATTKHLGGSRLYSAPHAMGYRCAASGPAGLNPVPHPFP